jgi:prevent-host-death family protein
MMLKSFSVTEARRNLPSLIREVEKGETVEVTRRGKPVAVLIPTKEYAELNGPSQDLWRAIQEFRHQFDLTELQIDEIYQNVRDR